MLNRCVLFADISNLYYTVGRKFENRKLDYERLYKTAQTVGSIVRCFAYGVQQQAEASAFISCLRKIGYEPKYREPSSPMEGEKRNIRRADWEVGIAVDAVRYSKRTDTVILCTANSAFVPLVEYLKSEGVKVVVLGCCISRELKDASNEWIEISVEHLEEIEAESFKEAS